MSFGYLYSRLIINHCISKWYFLPFYAILRAIPSKLYGVCAMFGALLILFPLAHTYNLRSNRYRPLLNLIFWIFVLNFLFLLWVGAQPISQPLIILGKLSTFIYLLPWFTCYNSRHGLSRVTTLV